MEKNAATGNDRKLAAIRPTAASSAIQQKMMPSPRAKFSAKPPSGYSTSTPSSIGNSSDVLLAFRNTMSSMPLSSIRFVRISKFVKGVRREAHRFALPELHFLRIADLPQTGECAAPATGRPC